MALRVLAGSYKGVVAQSKDRGATWQFGAIPEPPGTSISWKLAAGNGHIVAIGHDFGPDNMLPCNAAAYSADGLAWMASTLPSAQYWSNPVWTGSRFVVVGQDKAAWSVNGVSWTEVSMGFTLELGGTPYPPKAAVLRGMVVAGNATNLSVPELTTFFVTSTDHGETWTKRVETVAGGSISGFVVRPDDLMAVCSMTDYEPARFYISEPFTLTQAATMGGVIPGAVNATKTVMTENDSAYLIDSVTGDDEVTYSSPGMLLGYGRALVWAGDKFILGTSNYYVPSGLAASADGQSWYEVTASAHPNPPAGWVPDYYDVITYEAAQSGGVMRDTLELDAKVSVTAKQVFAAMVSTLSMTAGMAGTIRLAAAISDRMVLFSDGSAAFPVSASMRDVLSLNTLGQQAADSGNPAGTPTQFSMDAISKAISLYEGYDFNQFAKVGQDLYGQKPDGIYLLRGSTDEGEAINSALYLGATAFGSSLTKRVESIYLAAETDGSVTVTVVADHQEYSYRMEHYGPMLRAMVGKGLQGRTWSFVFQFEGAEVVEIDMAEVIVGSAGRRLRTSKL